MLWQAVRDLWFDHYGKHTGHSTPVNEVMVNILVNIRPPKLDSTNNSLVDCDPVLWQLPWKRWLGVRGVEFIISVLKKHRAFCFPIQLESDNHEKPTNHLRLRARRERWRKDTNSSCKLHISSRPTLPINEHSTLQWTRTIVFYPREKIGPYRTILTLFDGYIL